MEVREQARRRCEERCLVLTAEDEITLVSPGVYMLTVFDSGTKRMVKYRLYDKGNHCSLEHYY